MIAIEKIVSMHKEHRDCGVSTQLRISHTRLFVDTFHSVGNKSSHHCSLDQISLSYHSQDNDTAGKHQAPTLTLDNDAIGREFIDERRRIIVNCSSSIPVKTERYDPLS